MQFPTEHKLLCFIKDHSLNLAASSSEQIFLNATAKLIIIYKFNAQNCIYNLFYINEYKFTQSQVSQYLHVKSL